MTAFPPCGRAIGPAEIDRGFEDMSLFARSSYRLELLDWYTSPATENRLARFLAGEKVTEAERASWLATIRTGRETGRTMARVHVIADPLTDYLRYELACYESSAAAGEDIRILPADRAAGLDLPGFDYWLFDDERVAVQKYGDRGTWLGAELVTEPDFVSACRHWQDTAMSHAIPLSTYTAKRAASE